MSKGKRHITALVLVLTLMIGLTLALQSTYEEFNEGSYENIEISQGDDTISIDDEDSLARWTSTVLDSERNETTWLHVNWDGEIPSGADISARALSAEDFVSIGSVEGTDTQLTEWESSPRQNYSYLDYRTESQELIDGSIRGLDFDLDEQPADVWYSFEGTAETVKDFSGNGITGTIDTVLRTDGYSGQGVTFDGTQNFEVEEPNPGFTNEHGNMTIGMWVYPEDLSEDQTLIDKEDEFQLNLENSGEIWMRTYGDNNQGAASIQENTWTHIGVEWVSDDYIRTYVDGEQVDERTIDDISETTENQVYFGSTHDQEQHFTGSMDEVRVYRNQSDIQFMTDITDFTDTARASGEKVSTVDSEYVQARYQPSTEDEHYEVEETRIASNASFGDWRDEGEEMEEVPDNRYAVFQLNLSADNDGNSPEIDETRMLTATPDELYTETTAFQNQIIADNYEDLAVELSLNKSGIESLEPVEADYTFWNLREHCEYNPDTGYCEQINEHNIDTGDTRMFTSNQPLYESLTTHLEGSTTHSDSFTFTTPTSVFTRRDFQIRQEYEIDGETRTEYSNPVIDNLDIGNAQEGQSCRYSVDCDDGLYCGDTDQDGAPDTCVEQDTDLQGNLCEDLGSGTQERVSSDGYCELASSGLENENLLEGEACETSTDCATDYCYDSNDDGQMTCETTPTEGSDTGQYSSAQSVSAETCYFAGEAYSSGAEVDLFEDGVTNTCENGQWTQDDVRATVNYSSVEEGEQLELDYNVHNFKQGYDYIDGYVNRLTGNNIELEQIRVDISGEQFEKEISGTAEGLRNESGTVTLDMPELDYTDDLTAVTYIEYEYEGDTETLVANPLTGGPHSKEKTSGDCRIGANVEEGSFCLYETEEDPDTGAVETDSTDAGSLCQTRTADNVERRVTADDGACKVADRSAENNNLPDGDRCETEEDCVSDYCYDSGTGEKTCQTDPTPGSETGVDASYQSCDADSCFYEGQCFEEGTDLEGFSLGDSMTCEQGEWQKDKDISFEMEVPDQQFDGELPVDVTVHNHRDYCDYTLAECQVIEDNVLDIHNVTFTVKDHEPSEVTINERIPGEGEYSETLNLNLPTLDYTNASRIQAVLYYEFEDGEVKQTNTPVLPREQAWDREQEGDCISGYETDNGYFCLFPEDDEDEMDPSEGTVTDSSTDTGYLCREGAAATEERVTTGGACELSGPGVENSNLPDGYQCRDQDDCISDYCWDDNDDGVKTCQPETTEGTDDGNLISDGTDCPDPACNVRDECYEDGTEVPLEDQTLVCEDGELRSDTGATPMESPEDAIRSEKTDLGVELSLNKSGISVLESVEAEYTFWNPRQYCEYNPDTGYCELIDQNVMDTDEAQLHISGTPLWLELPATLEGSTRYTDTFDFTVPTSSWSDRDFQLEQFYNVESEQHTSVSNPVFDNSTLGDNETGDACRYSMDCDEGLYCGDTDQDGTPDTCVEQDTELQGNVCEDTGAGLHEQVGSEGTCEIASSGMENENLREGQSCETSTDCVTDYCYDGNDDGQMTCQTEPDEGTSSGRLSTPQEATADTCYFAGEVYSSGAELDIFDDGVTNTCENGRWTQDDVRATVDYSSVEEGEQLELDYNVHNFKQGFGYEDGFIDRLDHNDIELEQIRVHITGESFEEEISGTVPGLRNESGTATLDMPELNYTDDLVASTYIEYEYQGSTETVITSPLTGGPHSEELTDGSCRTGLQIGDETFCFYDTEQEPFSEGTVETSSDSAGDLCQTRTADNVERRVTADDGACKVADRGAENLNLPDGERCDTKEDCVSDYCYDSGTGEKTCQTDPTPGSETGVDAGPQSCDSDSCFYEGQCFEEGTTLEGFNLGDDMTCEQGEWDMDEEIAFRAEIPDQEISEEQIDVDIEVHNPYRYCDYTLFECQVIDHNILDVHNITFSIGDHEPFTETIEEEVPGEGVHTETLTVDMPELDYTESAHIQAALQYGFNDTVEESATPVMARGQTWERRQEEESCSSGFEADDGYYCLFDSEDENNFNPALGEIAEESIEDGNICRTEGGATEERVTTDGACELAGPGVENLNLPNDYQCRDQDDCISDYCWDNDDDGVKTCQAGPSVGSDDGNLISDGTDCPDPACNVRDQCYADGAEVPLGDQVATCEQGELGDRLDPDTMEPEQPSNIMSEGSPLAIDLSLNRTTGIVETDPLEADYTLLNTQRYCDYNPDTGYCEAIESNRMDTSQAQLFVNNQPIWVDIEETIYGSQTIQDTFEFTTPSTPWMDRSFQLQQRFEMDGMTHFSMSNTLFDQETYPRAEEGEACDYAMDCEEGLYCGDISGDGELTQCVEQESDLQGNMCEDMGSGVHERVDSDGYCELASSGMENENLLEGQSCETSTDCVTDYCYDGNDDGQMTCETSPTNGTEDGLLASPQSAEADTCYFAGEVYSEGAEEDLLNDGNTKTCENGRWTEEVGATVDYSAVDDERTLDLEYDINNFMRGYEYDDGFVDRLDENDIELEQIRVDISGEQFEKDISGTVAGFRNKSGTVSIEVPEIDHTDDLIAVTYIEYEYQGNTETMTASPLTGGPFSESISSGQCRTGLQVDEDEFCLYQTDEAPFSDGEAVSTHEEPGQLCQTRTADNVERRVTTDGACEPAERGIENNNLPDGESCDTKEDCLNDYCYDSGAGQKTCQSEPTSGTETGVDAGPQSCEANSCFYDGQCFEDGTTLDSFDVQEDMTCEAGRWDSDEPISVELDVPPTQIEDTIEAELEVHNHYEYCEYEDDVCEIIEDNFVYLEDITFSVKDHEPFTVDLDDQVIEGEGVHTETVEIEAPTLDYTDSSRMEAVMHYTDRDGTTRQSVTPLYTRGDTWEQTQVGQSCGKGYETDHGYFCLYDDIEPEDFDTADGITESTEYEEGNICRTGKGATEERVTTDGVCELSGPGVENLNQPDGYECLVQDDCISDYCWDDNDDGTMTCQEDETAGTQDGNKISDETDCAASACDVRDQCYADGATVPFEDQTLLCEDGELRDDVDVIEDPEEITSEFRDLEYEVTDTEEQNGVLEVEFTLTNQESETVTLHDSYITAGDEVEEHRTVNEEIAPDDSYSFTVTTDRPLSGVAEFMVESRVSSGEFDQWVTSDDTCYVTGWDEFQDTCLREDPTVQELTFEDYPEDHEFNITARGYDPNGAEDVEQCEVRIEGEGTQQTLEGDIDRSFGNERELICEYDSIDTSIENFEPNTHVRTTVTLTDSEGRTGTRIEGHQIPNRPPTHDRPEVDPDPALSGDDLEVTPQNVEDVEDDPITIEYEWMINNETLPYDTDTLGSGNTSVGDDVEAFVTPRDPWDEGETRSYELTIQEDEITIDDVQIDDYSDEHAFNISTEATSTDVEGTNTCQITASSEEETHELEGDIDREFGGNNQLSCNYTRLDDSFEGFEPTDILELEILVADINEANDTWTGFHEIPNRPPNVTEPEIDPDPAGPDNDLTGIPGETFDAEGDPVTFEYTWYINGLEQIYSGDTLGAGNFTVGDNVTFETTPQDPYEQGEPNSTTIDIEDIEFTVSDLQFQDYSDEHAFNTTAVVISDDIEEVEACEIEAIDEGRNNIFTQEMELDRSYGTGEQAICEYSNINDTIDEFEVNEPLDITVTATRDDDTQSVQGEHAIPNQPPTTTEPEIDPDPASEDDTLTGIPGQTEDPEDDPVELHVEWFVESQLVDTENISTDSDSELQPENFESGDEVSFNVTPHDPYDFGETNFTTTEIRDMDLNITDIWFENQSDQHGFDAYAEIESDDISELQECQVTAENDENSVTEEGSLDTDYGGERQALCEYTDITTETEGFEVFSEIEVTFEVSDTDRTETASDTHRIPNQPPEIEEVFTDPSGPVDEDDVTLNAEVTDPEDDPIQWTNFTVVDEDGVEVVDNENGTKNEQWTSPEFSVDPDVNYTWTIETFDTYNTTTEEGWFTTTNEPPEVTDIETENVTGDHAYRVHYTVEDPDGAEDIESCELEAWDSDDNSITGSASIDTGFGDSTEARCTYDNINDSIEGFEVNEMIEFNATVTDSVDQTDWMLGEERIPNRAPEIELEAPVDGESVTTPVNLVWEGYDEDGDDLDYEVEVAEDESFNNIVETSQTTEESYGVSGLDENRYYWRVTADDSYTTTESETRSFLVTSEIENVSITMEGEFEEVTTDGATAEPGTYTDLEHPYILMENPGLQGLISQGSLIEADYETVGDRDRVSITQEFTNEQMLLVANDGTSEDIQEREDQLTDGDFLSLPMANFEGEIPEENMITTSIAYTDINITGDDTIQPSSAAGIVVRNEGVEDGRVQVSIEEQ